MLIQLLDPPFDKSDLNPGYIKGYVPGIRENGGQYTHAAVWMIMAHAKLGNSQRAWELMSMINPINHSNTEDAISVYKAEPYVVAADVYSMAQNKGRAGWTWYTGSAGWMYQLILESLLGIRLAGNKLRLKPCVPAEWKSFKIVYRFRDTNYNITLLQKEMKNEDVFIEIDGVKQDGKEVNLIDDKSDHTVIINF
jgi:cellobiose phosphorylase